MPDEKVMCTVHGDEARWSYCGGYWFCESGYEDQTNRECAVADGTPMPDDEPVWERVDLGGEG